MWETVRMTATYAKAGGDLPADSVGVQRRQPAVRFPPPRQPGKVRMGAQMESADNAGRSQSRRCIGIRPSGAMTAAAAGAVDLARSSLGDGGPGLRFVRGCVGMTTDYTDCTDQSREETQI